MRVAFSFILMGFGLAIAYLVLNGVGTALSNIAPRLIGF